jgi:hypothetical protein
LESGEVLAIKKNNLQLIPEEGRVHDNESLLPLPDFCVGIVCGWLQPYSLLVVGRVSSVWKAEADQDKSWKRHCTSAWENKRGLLCIPRPTSLDSLLRGMKIRELKRLLQLNDVDMKGFRERTEFELALRSSYLCPKHSGRFIGPNFPAWLSQMNSWKASFFFMQVDCKRTQIRMPELCDENRTWTWHFDSNSNMAGYRIESTFRPDGSYQSSHEDGTNRTWQFIDGVVGESGSQIQVGDYPSLTVGRRADWSWTMHNAYGSFTETYTVKETDPIPE